MHRQALLSSAATLLFVGLPDCFADARRTISGHIRASTGHSKLHPADGQYVNESFPDDTDLRGWFFSDPPADQQDVFTDRTTQGQYSNDPLEADGDLFVLLFGVRMSREDTAFYNTALSPSWARWRDANIPIRRSPLADPEVFRVDADMLVCTHLSAFGVARGVAPIDAALRVFEHDDESDTAHGSDPEQTVATYHVDRRADQ